MYSVLDYVCVAATIAVGPVLLVLKFFWGRHTSWWIVIAAVIAISTVAGVVRDRIGPFAHNERFEACVRDTPRDIPAVPGVAVPVFPPSCGPMFYHVWTAPPYLKWISGIGILVLSMPIYGLAVWVRTRRAGVAAA